MPSQKMKEPQYQQRPADIAVAQSEKRMGAMSIIARSQIKVWKAMLFGLFFAGFIGALAWAVALDMSEGSEAANTQSVSITNIAPLATVVADTFAVRGQDGSDGWKLINDGDASAASVMARISQGEPPSIDFIFPGEMPRAMSSIAIALDPENPQYATCGLGEFIVMSSLDGNEFTKVIAGTKSNMAGFEGFAFPADWKAKVLRIIPETNHGDPDWFCIKEIKVIE